MRIVCSKICSDSNIIFLLHLFDAKDKERRDWLKYIFVPFYISSPYVFLFFSTHFAHLCTFSILTMISFCLPFLAFHLYLALVVQGYQRLFLSCMSFKGNRKRSFLFCNFVLANIQDSEVISKLHDFEKKQKKRVPLQIQLLKR